MNANTETTSWLSGDNEKLRKRLVRAALDLDFAAIDGAIAAGLPRRRPGWLLHQALADGLRDFSRKTAFHSSTRRWAQATDLRGRNYLLLNVLEQLGARCSSEYRDFLNFEVQQLMALGVDLQDSFCAKDIIRALAFAADTPDWTEGLRSLLQTKQGRQLLAPACLAARSDVAMERLVRAGLTEATQELLDFHADTMTQAVENQQLDLALGLLGNGVSVLAPTAKKMKTASEVGVSGHRHGWLGFYLSFGNYRNDDEKWYLRVLDRWLIAGLPIDDFDAGGCTPLQLTVARGRWNEAMALLRLGADPLRASLPALPGEKEPYVTASPLELVTKILDGAEPPLREDLVDLQRAMQAAVARRADSSGPGKIKAWP